MNRVRYEACPDCGALLPKMDGPTHRYIGASAGCWAIFAALNNAGEPPLAPAPSNALLVDAYAVQHPGQPSPQAIQSVAVHLLALYAVFAQGLPLDQVLWVRQRALREERGRKRDRFVWLMPPPLTGMLTVAEIVQLPMPQERSDAVAAYAQQVWSSWSTRHLPTIARWYTEHVMSNEGGVKSIR